MQRTEEIISVEETRNIFSQTLAKIHGECFFEKWNEEVFEKFLQDKVYKFLLARYEDKICGFLVFTYIVDEIEVITNCVLPDFQGRGVGKEMMKFLEHYARAHMVRSIHLEVAENNLPAVSLYIKFDFVPTTRRKNYYKVEGGKFVDAVLMRKEIF